MLTDATRTAYPNLTAQAEFVASIRKNPTFYARRIAHYPATLAGFVDYAFGTNPRAKDKKKGRAACVRELTLLASDADAAAALEATYRG